MNTIDYLCRNREAVVFVNLYEQDGRTSLSARCLETDHQWIWDQPGDETKIQTFLETCNCTPIPSFDGIDTTVTHTPTKDGK